MLSLFHRGLPIYYILLCAILGLSLAWCVTSEAEILLETPLKTNAATLTPATSNDLAVRSNFKPDDNRIILQRNIFNSQHPAQAAQVATNKSNTGLIKKPIKLAPSNLLLIGTVVAGNDSLAVISSNKVIEIFQLHQEISGSGTLARVMRNQVEIKNADGSLFMLVMDTSGATDSATNSSKKTAPSSKKSLVHNLGNNRWVIPVNEADKIRANIASIIKQIRIAPNVVNGKTAGFVVKRIQRNTLLDQMGIKRGDILHAVNGVTLNSPEKGLQIFQQLREATSLNLDLNRAGKSLNFQYEIK